MEEDAKTDSSLTMLLGRWNSGDLAAFDAVVQYVYDELHRRASAYIRNERPGHTLATTGLVHEAFIKLHEKKKVEWQDRNHFYAVAAQAMRRILVDHARRRSREKRGGKQHDLPLDDARYVAASSSDVDLVALDEALERLAGFDERQAKIVELKYFAGMALDETAEVLNVSRETVKRDWQLARAWLRTQLI